MASFFERLRTCIVRRDETLCFEESAFNQAVLIRIDWCILPSLLVATNSFQRFVTISNNRLLGSVRYDWPYVNHRF